MADKQPAWRFTEIRPIWPFLRSHSGLAGVGLCVGGGADYRSDDPWKIVMEPEAIFNESFRPTFQLAVNEKSLARESKRPAKNLELSLVLSDPALLRYTLINRWPLSGVPPVFEVPRETLTDVSGIRGLEFILQVSLKKKMQPDQTVRKASECGQIVCRRAYRIETPLEDLGFPVSLVDGSVFVDMDLPSDTVWVVKWSQSKGFDRPVEEVVRVLINKDVGQKLLRLSSADTVGQVLWNEIAVEVFVEICLVVFGRRRRLPDNPEGLLARLLDRFKVDFDCSPEELFAVGSSNVKGPRFFRAHVQTSLQMADRIKSVNLTGRRR